jgi:hypothetical protein
MKNLFIFFIFFSTNTYSMDYTSVHDETYWFYDDESSINGWYIGLVRSNLVYGDKLRFVISEDDCNLLPGMYLTLSTNIAQNRKDEPNFDIKTLENSKITFRTTVDEYEPFLITTTINIADHIDSVSSMFFIEFDDGMPRNFISTKKNNPDEFSEVMMLEIPQEDPNFKYFDITEMKFRMGGLANVWMHANQLCLDAGGNDD